MNGTHLLFKRLYTNSHERSADTSILRNSGWVRMLYGSRVEVVVVGDHRVGRKGGGGGSCCFGYDSQLTTGDGRCTLYEGC